MAEIQQDRVVGALDDVWSSLSELFGSLTPEQWALSTALPGWSVHDNLSHIIGTEAMLLGEPSPEVPLDRSGSHQHVQNDIGEFNEVWIEHLRSKQPDEVLDLFRRHTAARLGALQAMSPEEWTADSFTPSGPATYGRFMQIRVFDCWLHEQDVRGAVGLPGHERGVAVDVVLDEFELAMGYVIGKRAGAPDGTSVRIDLTDGDDVVRSFAVAVEGRAALVDDLPDPTAALRMPVGVFSRRCAGRVEVADVRDEVDISGDVELGERVLAAMPYTI